MASLGRKVRDDIGYTAVRCLLGGARVLPLPALRAIGRTLGAAAFALPGRDRTRTRDHLARAFPDRDQGWRDDVMRRCGRHLGTVIGEVAWLWSATPAEILGRTEFVGLENLTGRLAADRGAALVTGHCGNWEWLNLGLGARGVPMTVAARELQDPRFDELARRLRGRFGGESALRGKSAGARLVQGLRHGRVIGLLIDQDIAAPGAYAEFFGRPAWTPVGAALLPLRLGCPIVPGFAARQPNGTMRLEFDPPVEAVPGQDPQAEASRLTAVLTARIERQVRSYPEQWVWMHKRWRHQPGEGDQVWTGDGPRAGGERDPGTSDVR